MNNDFEFELEMEQQARQGAVDDTLLDVADVFGEKKAEATGDGLTDIFDTEGVGTAPGSVAESGTDIGVAENESGVSGEEAVNQDALNELVGNVTEMGADESVLGKDRLLDAFREAEESDSKGGSYVEGFTSAVQRMMGIKLDPDPVENSAPTNDTTQPEENGDARERFQHHKERYDAQFETASPWPRDTMTAYHRMAMTYNAYVSGEKINGVEVTKVDVFLSGVRFYQSNIFETAIIRSLRFAGDLIKEKYSEDKVETEQTVTETEQVKETKLKDDIGGFDHGDATAVSAEEVKTIRGSIKEYGVDYGLDTTRGLDRASTDNVKIFRATDYVGKVDVGPDKTASIPGVRMVEIDGNRALVTPDGKVAHESTRFQTGDGLREVDYARIESRCDVFRSPNLQDEIARMAESRGVTVETVKAEYVEKAMDSYASRIEKSMLGEADRLEHRTIPEAREELSSLREDLQKLDRIELSLGKEGVDAERGLSRAEIADLRSHLQNGIETLENRIDAMESRVELLRETHAKVDTSSVKERFENAAATEDAAVGRAGRIEYISSDVDKRLSDVIDAGTERVEEVVEKFNEAHPDMQLSYDADTGELFNHFGVSEIGGFNPEYATVEASELPADNPDAIKEYVAEHGEADFSEFKEFVKATEPAESVDVGTEGEHGTAVSEEDVTDLGSGAVTGDEVEETESAVLAGHDDDITTSAEEGNAAEVTPVTEENGDAEYSDKVKELLSEYLSDTEGTVSLQEDVQSPLADLTHDAGKTDFKDAMDILSDMVKGIENFQPEQLERISDLVHAIADISAVPADAVDSFQESIQGLDFAEDLIAEIGKPEILSTEIDIGGEAQVTIGDEELTIGDGGLHDAVTGDPIGGLPDDDIAAQYLEGTERALFDVPSDVETDIGNLEIGQSGAQHKMESLADTLDEITGGAVGTEDLSGEAVNGIEAGTEVAGGVEAAEAAGGAAAAEAAIEAGVAGSAAFL